MSIVSKAIKIFIYFVLFWIFTIFISSSGIIGKFISYKTNQTSTSIVQTNLFKFYRDNKTQIIIIGNLKFTNYFLSTFNNKNVIPLILVEPSLTDINRVLKSLNPKKKDKIIIQWFPYYLSNIYYSPNPNKTISLFMWNRYKKGFNLKKPVLDARKFFNSISYFFTDFSQPYNEYKSDNLDLSMISFDNKESEVKNIIRTAKDFKNSKIFWHEDFSKYNYNNKKFLHSYLIFIENLKKNDAFSNFSKLKILEKN